jgi:hypothetical protein
MATAGILFFRLAVETRDVTLRRETPQQKYGGYVARVFKFIDVSGCEIHTIEDPDDRLPVPTSKQVISIGSSRMLAESVTTLGNSETYNVYFVRVRTSAGTN